MPYAEPLTESQLDDALGRLAGWEPDGAAIRRTVDVGGFREAIDLVVAVADAADAADHHPDICVHDYRRVTFTLTTHAAGAVTRRDVDLAGTIDDLAAG